MTEQSRYNRKSAIHDLKIRQLDEMKRTRWNATAILATENQRDYNVCDLRVVALNFLSQNWL